MTNLQAVNTSGELYVKEASNKMISSRNAPELRLLEISIDASRDVLYIPNNITHYIKLQF